MSEIKRSQLEHISDEILAATVQNNPESPEAHEAFGEIFERFTTPLRGFVANNYISASGSAEDVVQTSMEKAWKSIESFDPEKGSFSNWLMGLASKTAIDHHRKEEVTRSGKKVAVTEDPSIIESRMDITVSELDEPFERAVFNDSIRRLRVNLTERQMRLIFDSIAGIKESETVAREQAPQGTVKSWIRQAKHQAREVLDVAA